MRRQWLTVYTINDHVAQKKKDPSVFPETVTNICSKEIKITFLSVKAVGIYLNSLTVCRGCVRSVGGNFQRVCTTGLQPFIIAS